MSISITKIKEAGSNNMLMWAINNQADIRSDSELMALINNELWYRVTINGVNMFELFRLIQSFRTDVAIIDTHSADVPTIGSLAEKFPGMFSDPDDASKQMPLSEVAEHAITSFTNIVQQMSSDDDIIRPGSAKMFIPMISRTFDVEIPVSFWDIANACKDQEFNKIFNTGYPSTLTSICDSPEHPVSQMIEMMFVKLTSIIRVNDRMERYINYTKYAPLSKVDDTNLYKLYLVGFQKYNPVSHSAETCSLFNINQEAITKALKNMSLLSTPLVLEFAVQMPIQMMMDIENLVGRDMLSVACESSMSSILEQGFTFNQCVTPNDNIDPSDKAANTEFMNAVSAYHVRLTDANIFMINAIKCITESKDSDITSAFAMLPSIYTTRAVMRVKSTDLTEIAKMCSAGRLSGLIGDMIETSNKIEADIRSAKSS